MKLKGQKLMIVGINGSGKSVCGTHIAENQFKRFIFFSPHEADLKDAPKGSIPIMAEKMNKEELDMVFFNAKQLCDKRQIDGIIVDDVDTFLKDEADIKACPNINHALINHRHYGEKSKKDQWGLGIIFMSRRPQNVPSSLFEICEYNIYFSCPTSDNVKRKLNAIDEDLYAMVNQLEYKSFKFVIKEIGKKPERKNPINLNSKQLNKEQQPNGKKKTD